MKKHEYVSCLQHRQDCDSYQDGQCTALKDADFGDRPCPFYKSIQQAEHDWLDTIAQLVNQGKYEEAYRCSERGWMLL